GGGPIQYPVLFWKVVAVTVTPRGEEPSLRVFGFLLSQKSVVDRFGIEKFTPGSFKRYQVALTEIEEVSGVRFASVLHDADTMRGEARGIEIRDVAQMRGVNSGAVRAGAGTRY